MYLSEVKGKGGIEAKVVAASIANNIPIWTVEITAPKFIDAELRTHRIFEQSCSSSRAIPFEELDEIYLPFDIRKNQKGMQGYEKVGPSTSEKVRYELECLYNSVFDWLDDINMYLGPIHKQHLNRYIEPWMFQKRVITATEWSNFFKLRLAEDVMPEAQEVARCVKEAMDQVKPYILQPGDWHVPYVGDGFVVKGATFHELEMEKAKKCSAARCARTSYKNQDKSDSIVEKDLDLFEDLVNSEHWTPSGHQATPMEYINLVDEKDLYGIGRKEPIIHLLEMDKGVTHIDRKGNCWSGPFRGWIQHRQLLQEWNP